MDRILATCKALADETRLRVVRILTQGSFNVNELARILGMGQSRVSRHLRILLDAGLVTARREGSWAYYTLSGSWTGGRERAARGQERRPSPRFLRLLASELARASETPQAAADDEAVRRSMDERRSRAETFFRGVAERWDSERDRIAGPPEHLDLLVEMLGRPRTTVDLGTGTGVLLSRLAARSARVIGIDAAEEMLRVARRRVVDEELPGVELRLGSLEHLPLSDGEADVMVANMVLHHVANPPDALREVRRGLREGGRFVLADFAAHLVESYRERLGDLWLGFRRDELESWLAEAGLIPEGVKEIAGRDGRPGVLLLSARKVAETTGDPVEDEAPRRRRSAPAEAEALPHGGEPEVETVRRAPPAPPRIGRRATT